MGRVVPVEYQRPQPIQAAGLSGLGGGGGAAGASLGQGFGELGGALADALNPGWRTAQATKLMEAQARIEGDTQIRVHQALAEVEQRNALALQKQSGEMQAQTAEKIARIQTASAMDQERFRAELDQERINNEYHQQGMLRLVTAQANAALIPKVRMLTERPQEALDLLAQPTRRIQQQQSFRDSEGNSIAGRYLSNMQAASATLGPAAAPVEEEGSKTAAHYMTSGWSRGAAEELAKRSGKAPLAGEERDKRVASMRQMLDKATYESLTAGMPEGQTKEAVWNLYVASQNRMPKEAGDPQWVASQRAKIPDEVVGAEFIAANNMALLNDAFATVLGRAEAAGGLQNALMAYVQEGKAPAGFEKYIGDMSQAMGLTTMDPSNWGPLATALRQQQVYNLNHAQMLKGPTQLDREAGMVQALNRTVAQLQERGQTDITYAQLGAQTRADLGQAFVYLGAGNAPLQGTFEALGSLSPRAREGIAQATQGAATVFMGTPGLGASTAGSLLQSLKGLTGVLGGAQELGSSREPGPGTRALTDFVNYQTQNLSKFKEAQSTGAFSGTYDDWLQPQRDAAFDPETGKHYFVTPVEREGVISQAGVPYASKLQGAPLWERGAQIADTEAANSPLLQSYEELTSGRYRAPSASPDPANHYLYEGLQVTAQAARTSTGPARDTLEPGATTTGPRGLTVGFDRAYEAPMTAQGVVSMLTGTDTQTPGAPAPTPKSGLPTLGLGGTPVGSQPLSRQALTQPQPQAPQAPQAPQTPAVAPAQAPGPAPNSAPTVIVQGGQVSPPTWQPQPTPPVGVLPVPVSPAPFNPNIQGTGR